MRAGTYIRGTSCPAPQITTRLRKQLKIIIDKQRNASVAAAVLSDQNIRQEAEQHTTRASVRKRSEEVEDALRHKRQQQQQWGGMEQGYVNE
jgi:hypothetical protein